MSSLTGSVDRSHPMCHPPVLHFIPSLLLMTCALPAQVNWYNADARYGHAIAGGANLVLFGGTTNGTGALGDTWVRGNTGGWTRQAAATGPTAVFNHDMALESTSTDTAARVVVFGGRRALGAAGLSDQTWIWDGVRWGSGGAAPLGLSPRERHAMVLDTARNRVVLFGGQDSAGSLAQTWEWSGTWSQVFPLTSPAARWGHAMAFDQVSGRVVLFGGNFFRGDTWTFDGTTWTLDTRPAAPPGRLYHALAFDEARRSRDVRR